jgi:hypothetical protein
MSEHDEQAALIQWAQLQANTTTSFTITVSRPLPVLRSNEVRS